MRVGAAGRASPVVASLREHKSWVVGVCQARAASVYSLVSGSVTADVRFWDLRRPASVHMIAAHRTPMTALALHDFAPLLATGARRQQARVFTNSGEAVADIRFREAAAPAPGGAPPPPQQQATRIGPVSAVAFHPHRLYLGVGSLDGSLSVHAGAPALSEAAEA
jgi:regulator-associated protein of mTOR